MSQHVSESEGAALGTAMGRPLVLAACMMAMFMAAVESTIVATAMPTIVADLGGFRLFSWVFAIYLLCQAVTIPIYGRLADLFGRKRVFYAGAGLFLLGSALCGFARGMIALVLFRALQGLGAGAIVPIATTIVGDIYAPAERARLQGWLASVWGVSAILGPLLGAFLVQHVHWSVVFWVNLPIGLAAIAMLGAFLRERRQRRQHRIDRAGAVLLVLGTGALMLALIQAQSLGGAVVAVLLTVAAAALAILVVHERKAAEPMLPLHLWRQRIIAVGSLGGFVIGAVMMGITAFLPAYVQGAMGRSALVAGFALTAMSVGWSVASGVAGRVMVRTSYRTTAVIGGFALIAGSLVLIAMSPARGPVWAGTGAILVGIGMGFCNTTFVVSVQSSVGWGERGVATSSTLFMRMVGQAIGAAIFGAILNLGLGAAVAASGDTVDRLMNPSLRGGLPASEVARLAGAVAGALHQVYLVAGLLAVGALALTLWLPARLSPTTPAD